ncbi:MAG: aldehyde dehydrogenase family protein [Methanomicrobiales archaeon]|nr:aldehyde dehydrogenase family protein [Methanomicrobiales archaeon]NYT21037.1 aldehyde dehydrogenase family protein [Methanomicrobiales archaeon]
MTAENVPEYRFLIGGEWRTNPGPREVKFPYTGETIAVVHQAAGRDLDDAAGIAAEAVECTRHLSSAEKSRILSSIADQVEARAAELAGILVLEGGKTRSFAALEVQRAVATLRTSAEEARRIGGELIPLDWSAGAEGRIGITRRFPAGPVLGITPFNFPLNLACHKLGPAVAAGNPLILKPASATPVSSLLLAEMALRAGLPREALSVVPCSGEVAERLVSDPRIAVLTFTGSPAVGWHLRELAGRKKVTLELGGNAAAIVHDDADTGYAASRIVTGGYTNAGQVCISVQRVFLHDAIYDAMLTQIRAGVAALITGDPRDDHTDVGPMISLEAAERAGQMVDEAVAGGARILYGGTRRGSMVAPTILTGTTPEMRVEQEEVFAPVITISRYTDFEDALSRANRSRYGMQLGVFTRDIGRIMKAFEESEVGGVVANDIPTFRVDHMPYGGVKGSGTGKEGPRYAIREMTEERLLILDTRSDRS